MTDQTTPHLTSADRLDGNLIITFDDGKCGLYSSDLLYATLAQAKQLHEQDDQEQGMETPANLNA
ncbi:MAG: hypothetical protein ACRYHB_13780 [Janthinobacterium lividum]